MINNFYSYFKASPNFEAEKFNPKSKLISIFQTTATLIFKKSIFSSASIFVRKDKKGIKKARENLTAIGGQSLKIKTQKNNTIDAMYLKSSVFKKKLEHYFDLYEDENDGQTLILKDKYLEQDNEDPSGNFENVRHEKARAFCLCLRDIGLRIGSQTDIPDSDEKGVAIHLNPGSRKREDLGHKQTPTVLYCPGKGSSFPLYSREVTSYLMRGMDVMLFDYPGVGKSKGSPTSHKTKAAAEACYQYIRTTCKKKRRNILVHGHSLGGGTASDLAARRKGVNLLIDRSFTTLSEVAATRMPKLRKLILWFLPKVINYNTAANLPKVRGHVAIVKAKKDAIIPAAHAKKNIAIMRECVRENQVFSVIKSKAGHDGNWAELESTTEKFDQFLIDAGLMRGLF